MSSHLIHEWSVRIESGDKEGVMIPPMMTLNLTTIKLEAPEDCTSKHANRVYAVTSQDGEESKVLISKMRPHKAREEELLLFYSNELPPIFENTGEFAVVLKGHMEENEVPDLDEEVIPDADHIQEAFKAALKKVPQK